MKTLSLPILVTILFCSGCATAYYKGSSPTASNGTAEEVHNWPSDSLESTSGSQESTPPEGIASRDFLFRDTLPDKGYGAYGYCLLTKRPDLHSRDRFIKIASVYLTNLEHTDSFEPTIPSSELMPTYWFLRVSASAISPEEIATAESLVNLYDYARAKVLLRSIKKNGSEGPILVAWQQPFETIGVIDTALIFDLSTFSDEDMERAVRIWISRIVKEPSLWNEGFRLVKFREELRSFLQRYGEHILAVITPDA